MPRNLVGALHPLQVSKPTANAWNDIIARDDNPHVSPPFSPQYSPQLSPFSPFFKRKSFSSDFYFDSLVDVLLGDSVESLLYLQQQGTSPTQGPPSTNYLLEFLGLEACQPESMANSVAEGNSPDSLTFQEGVTTSKENFQIGKEIDELSPGKKGSLKTIQAWISKGDEIEFDAKGMGGDVGVEREAGMFGVGGGTALSGVEEGDIYLHEDDNDGLRAPYSVEALPHNLPLASPSSLQIPHHHVNDIATAKVLFESYEEDSESVESFEDEVPVVAEANDAISPPLPLSIPLSLPLSTTHSVNESQTSLEEVVDGDGKTEEGISSLRLEGEGGVDGDKLTGETIMAKSYIEGGKTMAGASLVESGSATKIETETEKEPETETGTETSKSSTSVSVEGIGASSSVISESSLHGEDRNSGSEFSGKETPLENTQFVQKNDVSIDLQSVAGSRSTYSNLSGEERISTGSQSEEGGEGEEGSTHAESVVVENSKTRSGGSSPLEEVANALEDEVRKFLEATKGRRARWQPDSYREAVAVLGSKEEKEEEEEKEEKGEKEEKEEEEEEDSTGRSSLAYETTGSEKEDDGGEGEGEARIDLEKESQRERKDSKESASMDDSGQVKVGLDKEGVGGGMVLSEVAISDDSSSESGSVSEGKGREALQNDNLGETLKGVAVLDIQEKIQEGREEGKRGDGEADRLEDEVKSVVSAEQLETERGKKGVAEVEVKEMVPFTWREKAVVVEPPPLLERLEGEGENKEAEIELEHFLNIPEKDGLGGRTSWSEKKTILENGATIDMMEGGGEGDPAALQLDLFLDFQVEGEPHSLPYSQNRGNYVQEERSGKVAIEEENEIQRPVVVKSQEEVGVEEEKEEIKEVGVEEEKEEIKEVGVEEKEKEIEEMEETEEEFEDAPQDFVIEPSVSSSFSGDLSEKSENSQSLPTVVDSEEQSDSISLYLPKEDYISLEEGTISIADTDLRTEKTDGSGGRTEKEETGKVVSGSLPYLGETVNTEKDSLSEVEDSESPVPLVRTKSTSFAPPTLIPAGFLAPIPRFPMDLSIKAPTSSVTTDSLSRNEEQKNGESETGSSPAPKTNTTTPTTASPPITSTPPPPPSTTTTSPPLYVTDSTKSSVQQQFPIHKGVLNPSTYKHSRSVKKTSMEKPEGSILLDGTVDSSKKAGVGENRLSGSVEAPHQVKAAARVIARTNQQDLLSVAKKGGFACCLRPQVADD